MTDAAEGQWLRQRLAESGEPVEIYVFLKAIKGLGRVRFYCCWMAATFGVDESNPIPECDGIVDSFWFLNEKAAKAGHCRYF